LEDRPPAIERFCHRPIVITDPGVPLGQVLGRFRACGEYLAGDVICEHVILVWGAERRIITGADILGRLLRGISRRY
jgi:hypothetical protein